MPELDPLEYPEGSQKRQEELRRLEKEDNQEPEQFAQVKVPEEVWRGNGGQG